MTNGADILAHTLAENGVDTCFANPGTTEMHLLAALGREDRINLHLCLFEGVATGAADGYARMAGKPASVLLHLGPGLANGMANLHNARKAATPLVTIVGEHATYHLENDAPLTADIAGMARTVSDHVVTPQSADEVAEATSRMMAAIRQGPERVATMIVPNDVAWNDAGTSATQPVSAPASGFDETSVAAAAAAISSGGTCALLIGAPHITPRMAELAAAIEATSGARVFAEAAVARMTRGGAIPALRRLPFHVDFAAKALEGITDMVLVGARAPVAFFAYPGRPSRLLDDDIGVTTLAAPLANTEAALEALAAALHAKTTPATPVSPEIPEEDAAITAPTLGQAIAAALPDGAIIVDESITNGLNLFADCGAGPARHDWINNRGGSIGYSMPVAYGAATACPDRPVLCITGDGSAAYTPQALWSMARAGANVTVVILANRSYKILANEMSKIGAGTPDETTLPMMTLEGPAPDWVKIAEGHGVAALRVDSAGTLSRAVAEAMRRPGPTLIEAVM